MSKVYLISGSSSDDIATVEKKVSALWQRADLAGAFSKRDLAALKLHVGEPGTKTFVSPKIVKTLVRCIAKTGAKPFLTDTAVLYKSRRGDAVGHVRVAHDHGFGLLEMGAPFISADGLNGSDDLEVDVGVSAKHYEKVSIASGIMQARSMLVLTHATGHLATGLGGAIKNLGMGCGSKKAKLSQHFGQKPHIDADKCSACGECATWCPSDAIDVEQSAVIDPDKCIGCGECIAVCLDSAVQFDWSIMGRALQERIVEHAVAVARGKPNKICYITVAQDITKDCDCLGVNQKPLLEDIGILASFDPVALDKAVLDLVQQRAGRTLESMSYPKTNGTIQIDYAESLGLGESTYDLVSV
ncbi:MAG: DUF362 domain-containing protein [Deltaproteobacteria bacterium]|nr:DUF362 domain-containing protein [Deltaproteobacteria bacterium]